MSYISQAINPKITGCDIQTTIYGSFNLDIRYTKCCRTKSVYNLRKVQKNIPIYLASFVHFADNFFVSLQEQWRDKVFYNAVPSLRANPLCLDELFARQ